MQKYIAPTKQNNEINTDSRIVNHKTRDVSSLMRSNSLKDNQVHSEKTIQVHGVTNGDGVE